jgi:hypothetical protein
MQHQKVSQPLGQPALRCPALRLGLNRLNITSRLSRRHSGRSYVSSQAFGSSEGASSSKDWQVPEQLLPIGNPAEQVSHILSAAVEAEARSCCHMQVPTATR